MICKLLASNPKKLANSNTWIAAKLTHSQGLLSFSRATSYSEQHGAMAAKIGLGNKARATRTGPVPEIAAPDASTKPARNRRAKKASAKTLAVSARRLPACLSASREYPLNVVSCISLGNSRDEK
jgi:hypothetical protein